jgi:hypothetical protein
MSDLPSAISTWWRSLAHDDLFEVSFAAACPERLATGHPLSNDLRRGHRECFDVARGLFDEVVRTADQTGCDLATVADPSPSWNVGPIDLHVFERHPVEARVYFDCLRLIAARRATLTCDEPLVVDATPG